MGKGKGKQKAMLLRQASAERHELRKNWASTSVLSVGSDIADEKALDTNLDELDTQDASTRLVDIGSYSKVGNFQGIDKFENEDRVFVATASSIEALENTILTGYASVFDGHGGHHCADYVCKRMFERVCDEFKDAKSWDNAENILLEIFHGLDAEYSAVAKELDEFSGTCATVVLVKNNQVIVANIGDCKAAQFSEKGKLRKATNDHRAQNEIERINLAGGKVLDGRVSSLEPSRSFGDIDVKEETPIGVIISTPEITRMNIEETSKDFIVVASDGLWDRMHPKRVGKHGKNLLAKCKTLNDASKAFVERARTTANNDDITVALIKF